MARQLGGVNHTMLRAAFIGSGNLHDMTFASGSPFFMRRALERRVEPALVIDDPWPRWFLGAKSVATTATVGRFHADWSPRLTALAGARTVARVRAARPDIVFALMASPLAHLLVDEFRVVHASDTTLHAMFGYYNSFDKFSASTRRGGEIIEAKVLRGAFLSVFASDWARQSAIRDYGVPPAVAHDIAWGANVDNVRGAARKLPAGELRFLFNGVDWKRKGGAIAVSTIAELTRRGIPARLDVIGHRRCHEGRADTRQRHLPRLYRQDDRDRREQIQSPLRRRNLFLVADPGGMFRHLLRGSGAPRPAMHRYRDGRRAGGCPSRRYRPAFAAGCARRGLCRRHHGIDIVAARLRSDVARGAGRCGGAAELGYLGGKGGRRRFPTLVRRGLTPPFSR